MKAHFLSFYFLQTFKTRLICLSLVPVSGWSVHQVSCCISIGWLGERPKISPRFIHGSYLLWYCFQRRCGTGKMISEILISLEALVLFFPFLSHPPQNDISAHDGAASWTGFDLAHQSATPLMSGWHQTVDGPNSLRSFKSNNIIFPTRYNFLQVVINTETQINTTKSDRSDTEELRCEISLEINKLIIHSFTKVNKEDTKTT